MRKRILPPERKRGELHSVQNDQREQEIEDDRCQGKRTLKLRDDKHHAAAVPPGHQDACPQTSDRAAEQGGVERIPDIAVLFLKTAEGAVMGGEFIDVEADERDQ